MNIDQLSDVIIKRNGVRHSILAFLSPSCRAYVWHPGLVHRGLAHLPGIWHGLDRAREYGERLEQLPLPPYQQEPDPHKDLQDGEWARDP